MWRVGILGAGRMGLVHAEAWAAAGHRARVVSVASRTPADWPAKLGAEHIGDIETAIAAQDVDVIDICLPTSLHLRATQLALDAGKHVLLEKPLALTEDEANAVVAAAEASDRTVMIAHVVRFFPAYRQVKEIVESGELGPAVGVSTYRAGWGNNEIPWMRDLTGSGGVAVDLLVHDYDQMNMYLSEPRTAYARRLADGSVHTLVEYAGDRVGAAEGNSATPPHYPFSTAIRVTCEAGLVEHFAGFGGGHPTIRVWQAGGAYKDLPVSGPEPYAAQAAYFLDRLDDGAPVEEGSPTQGRDAVAIAAAALRSTFSGVPEEVLPAAGTKR